MDVTEVIDHYGDTIVRAAYDGDYDKTGLPDPLILTNYISVRDGKIVSLITIHHKPSTSRPHQRRGTQAPGAAAADLVIAPTICAATPALRSRFGASRPATRQRTAAFARTSRDTGGRATAFAVAPTRSWLLHGDAGLVLQHRRRTSAPPRQRSSTRLGPAMRLRAAFRIPERKPRCDAGPRRLLVGRNQRFGRRLPGYFFLPGVVRKLKPADDVALGSTVILRSDNRLTTLPPPGSGSRVCNDALDER